MPRASDRSMVPSRFFLQALLSGVPATSAYLPLNQIPCWSGLLSHIDTTRVTRLWLKTMANGDAVALARALYRTLLRAHRELPQPQRSLGDRVVSVEWRAMAGALRAGKATPEHITAFVSGWQDYAFAMAGGEPGGALADEATLRASLLPEQREQLERLREEAERLKEA